MIQPIIFSVKDLRQLVVELLGDRFQAYVHHIETPAEDSDEPRVESPYMENTIVANFKNGYTFTIQVDLRSEPVLMTKSTFKYTVLIRLLGDPRQDIYDLGWMSASTEMACHLKRLGASFQRISECSVTATGAEEMVLGWGKIVSYITTWTQGVIDELNTTPDPMDLLKLTLNSIVEKAKYARSTQMQNLTRRQKVTGKISEIQSLFNGYSAIYDAIGSAFHFGKPDYTVADVLYAIEFDPMQYIDFKINSTYYVLANMSIVVMTTVAKLADIVSAQIREFASNRIYG